MAAVVSYADESTMEFRDTFWKNQSEYCRVNGYRWVGFTDSFVIDGRHPSWNKIPIMLNMLSEEDVVWWMDADIFPIDYSVPLPEFRDDVCIAYDDHGYNAGIIGLKQSDKSRQFLFDVWQQEDCIFAHTWEQAAIKRILPESELTVRVLPKRFNAHPVEIESGTIPNPVFVHCYAMSKQERIQYYEKLQRNTETDTETNMG